MRHSETAKYHKEYDWKVAGIPDLCHLDKLQELVMHPDNGAWRSFLDALARCIRIHGKQLTGYFRCTV